jgi:hypothetical protein
MNNPHAKCFGLGGVLISAFLLLTSVSHTAVASTFTVTNTNDSGSGSLRQAIIDANNHAGADIIDFNIPGSVVQTITPASALPYIISPVTIDGYTQPGSSRNTHAITLGDNSVHLIEIDGTNTRGSNGAAVLKFNTGADGSMIQGLVVNRGSACIAVFGISNVTVQAVFSGPIRAA